MPSVCLMVCSEDCKSSQFRAFSVRSRNLSGFICVCVCVKGFYCTESQELKMANITHVYEQQTRSARYTHITNISRLDHAVAVIRWTLKYKHSCMYMWLTLNRLVLFLSQKSPCAGMCFSCCHGTLLPSNTSRAHCRFCENTNIFSQLCMQEGERACDDLNWVKSEESLTASLAHTLLMEY